MTPLQRPNVEFAKLVELRDKLVGDFIAKLREVIPLDEFSETQARNIAEYEVERLITERVYEAHLRNEAKRAQEEVDNAVDRLIAERKATGNGDQMV